MPVGCAASNLLFFAALFAVLYFVFLRPRRTGPVKAGDEVATRAGLVGRVKSVEDETVTLELASGVKVQVTLESVEPLPPPSKR